VKIEQSNVRIISTALIQTLVTAVVNEHVTNVYDVHYGTIRPMKSDSYVKFSPRSAVYNVSDVSSGTLNITLTFILFYFFHFIAVNFWRSKVCVKYILYVYICLGFIFPCIK